MKSNSTFWYLIKVIVLELMLKLTLSFSCDRESEEDRKHVSEEAKQQKRQGENFGRKTMNRLQRKIGTVRETV